MYIIHRRFCFVIIIKCECGVVFPPSVKESGTKYTATKVTHSLILEDKGEQTSVPKEHIHNTRIIRMKTHEILSHTKHNGTIIWAKDSVFSNSCLRTRKN